MTTVQTKYLGEIRIQQSSIINFPSAIPGFMNEFDFALLDLPGNPLFQTLQSIMTPELAFVVVNPYHFYKDYEFVLDDHILEHLNITNQREVNVLAIVTLKEPFKQSTLNLKAPLIINTTLSRAKQYVLDKEEYPTKTPIVPFNPISMKGDE